MLRHCSSPDCVQAVADVLDCDLSVMKPEVRAEMYNELLRMAEPCRGAAPVRNVLAHTKATKELLRTSRSEPAFFRRGRMWPTSSSTTLSRRGELQQETRPSARDRSNRPGSLCEATHRQCPSGAGVQPRRRGHPAEGVGVLGRVLGL